MCRCLLKSIKLFKGIIASENKLSCGSTGFFFCSIEQENAPFVVVVVVVVVKITATDFI